MIKKPATLFCLVFITSFVRNLFYLFVLFRHQLSVFDNTMANNNNNLASEVCNAYERMTIEEEKEGGLIVEGDDGDEGGETNIDFQYCLVGGFLTDKMINFSSMKNTMASLWHPWKGVYIKDMSSTLFLFQFFHEIDINRVLNSGPWTFDQHILIVKRLEENEQP